MQQLFSEFKPVTAAEWKAQLVKDLKGEAIESLVWKNENGIDIQPFYTAEDLRDSYTPAFTHADWDICVHAQGQDAKTVNELLLKNLNSGATSISVHCGGLDLPVALEGVQLNYICATFYATVTEALQLKLFLEKVYTLEELNCSIFPASLASEKDLQDWKQVSDAFRNHPNIRTVCIDALPTHNSNCLPFYEVAVILAGLNEYLNGLQNNSLPIADVAIRTGVTADYFVQMAKLRALRRLWKLLSTEYKITNGLHVIAETSATNKSISDNYNNLLRTTVEAMAAVSGGCNELTVGGFDMFLPVNKPLSERMAINQQLILKEESYLDKMADVACGSYYLESLTDAIAEKALDTLKRFEKEGGYFACLGKNSFETEISVQAQQRDALVNNQKQIAIGVNKFRNEKENIRLSEADLNRLKQLHIHNPVLNFELGHYFKEHA